MKTDHAESRKPAVPAQRPFTWSIRATEIPFMPLSGAEAAMEGCYSCDCGAITRTDKLRQERPGGTGE